MTKPLQWIVPLYYGPLSDELPALIVEVDPDRLTITVGITADMLTGGPLALPPAAALGLSDALKSATGYVVAARRRARRAREAAP